MFYVLTVFLALYVMIQYLYFIYLKQIFWDMFYGPYNIYKYRSRCKELIFILQLLTSCEICFNDKMYLSRAPFLSTAFFLSLNVKDLYYVVE